MDRVNLRFMHGCADKDMLIVLHSVSHVANFAVFSPHLTPHEGAIDLLIMRDIRCDILTIAAVITLAA